MFLQSRLVHQIRIYSLMLVFCNRREKLIMGKGTNVTFATCTGDIVIICAFFWWLLHICNSY